MRAARSMSSTCAAATSPIGCAWRAWVEELYDVIALPGVKRPMGIGFKGDEIRRVISVGETRDANRFAISDPD